MIHARTLSIDFVGATSYAMEHAPNEPMSAGRGNLARSMPKKALTAHQRDFLIVFAKAMITV